jgi:hypothetical protein
MEFIRNVASPCQTCKTDLKTNSRICDDGNFLEDKFKRFTLFIKALIERNEQVRGVVGNNILLLQNNNASLFLALIRTCDEFKDIIEYARKDDKINRKKAVVDLIEKNALSSGLDSANILAKEEYDLLIRYIELFCSVIASQ